MNTMTMLSDGDWIDSPLFLHYLCFSVHMGITYGIKANDARLMRLHWLVRNGHVIARRELQRWREDRIDAETVMQVVDPHRRRIPLVRCPPKIPSRDNPHRVAIINRLLAKKLAEGKLQNTPDTIAEARAFFESMPDDLLTMDL